MKIIFCEMRKSWLKSTTFIVLIVLTVLNFIRMNDLCRTKYSLTYGELGEAYFRIYETVCGELDEEKLAPLRTRAKELENEVMDKTYSTEYQPDKFYTGYVFGDFMLYNVDIAPEITYCATYPNASNKIVSNALERHKFYKSVGNDFETKKSAMIYNSYQDRIIPEYRATNWTGLFFQYEFSSLLCIVMLILGLSSSFSIEKESGMFQLITAAGRNNRTTVSKICSSAAYCAFLSVWFTACDLIFTNFLLGVKGIDMPLYSAQMFEKTPFMFSFIGAIILWAGIRFLVLLVLALIMLLISKIMPNTIIAMVASFGASLGLILLTSLSKSVWNPICALTPNAYITEFSVVNIFGEPVLTLFAALIALAAECVILGSVVFMSDRGEKRKTPLPQTPKMSEDETTA